MVLMHTRRRRRIGLSDQAGTGIRAIFRNWRELGYVPPNINNDKSKKSFELILLKQHLVAPHQKEFLQSLGVRLSANEANVFAYATENNKLSLTDIRALTNTTTSDAYQIAKRLVKQMLLTELSEEVFELVEVMKERYGYTNAKENDQQPGLRPELQLELQLESRLESPLAAKVMLFLAQEEMGKALLASELGHKTVSGELNKQVKRLLEMDLIEMTIPEKPNSSKQKYRLSAAGKELLRHIVQNKKKS